MDNRTEIIRDVKKALEFYQALGFDRLPVKIADVPDFPAKSGFAERRARLSGPGRLWRRQRRVNLSDLAGRQVSEETEAYHLDKKNALNELIKEIGGCKRCRLSNGRKNIVFGEGDPDAKIMFIGEGPGREEDIQARPFVGDAGTVLTNLIKKMGLQREDVYIANVVKCRPPDNRNPEEDEIKICSLFLDRQIDIIKPRVIMALGKFSAQKLTGSKIPISRLRGEFHECRGIPVMPTFHPAYLMRNPKDKWLTWGDAQKVLERLKRP
jgi:DNA polymerase